MTRQGAAILVVILMAASALVDLVTPPEIASGVLYIPAVAVTAWYWGARPAFLLAFLSTVVTLMADSLTIAAGSSSGVVQINEGLLSVTFFGTAWALFRLAAQQRTIEEQRDRVRDLQQRLEDDMNEARRLQDLMYSQPPSDHQAEVAVISRAARIMGGDAVRVDRRSDGSIAIVLADASGKGSPAALAVSVVLGMLGNQAGRDPGRVLADINRQLVTHLQGERFVTLFYGQLDVARGVLAYASAGHEPVLLWRGQQMEELSSTGLVLGVLEEADYETRHVQLLPRDLLVGYTDGVTDLPSGEGRLGLEGLAEIITRHTDSSSQTLADEILHLPEQTHVEPPDDMSLFALRWSP